ncbi:hypothetical protein AJ80_06556 [Polytolypa hystricis UAMH7299]|uniref:Carboxylic ester hydrolase n=1 Tax=Polytolypa hystricis (strain UAMH7299) TaxID=1447883 RepID=A0A2B7XWG3_POLH7|nr:hypothetical protein AJ80_06556 [Polytolypa hystricis UAMH7299]
MLSIRRLASLALLVSSALGAQLTQVNNYGENPTGVQMWVYVPDNRPQNPAVIVAMHWCTGTAQAYYSGTQYARQADSKGFIVIYPDAPDSGGCWDVHSDATLRHDAGGDSKAIASMVKYAIQNYGADPNKIFMTGTSSGAMMVNVLAGSYPDLFKAGSANAGVPFGCFRGQDMWHSQCANGQVSKSAQQWGDDVRNAYPGYGGPRPKMLLFHGANDDTLRYPNYNEALKQWSNVHGVSLTSTKQNTFQNGYTESIYGNGEVVGYSVGNGPHNLPAHEDKVLAFFGL